MKSVIPFSKELDFSGKLSEITSISLEREFEILEGSIDGNLFVTGDYKSHEVSANVIPFSFKIPFSIEIPDDLNTETITLEISDFAYDLIEDSKIKVNIELELNGEILEKVKEEEEEKIEVDSEEIIKMMEERMEEEEEVRQEEITSIEEEIEEEEKQVKIEEEQKEEMEDRIESEEVILENVSTEEEYSTYHIHIVKEGENVETICTMYNSNLNLLSEYNNIGEITTGEKIIIPASDES